MPHQAWLRLVQQTASLRRLRALLMMECARLTQKSVTISEHFMTRSLVSSWTLCVSAVLSFFLANMDSPSAWLERTILSALRRTLHHCLATLLHAFRLTLVVVTQSLRLPRQRRSVSMHLFRTHHFRPCRTTLARRENTHLTNTNPQTPSHLI